MNNFFAFLLLFLICYGKAQTTLQPAQMQEDFSQLTQELVERNRGLYKFYSKDDFEKRVQDFTNKLKVPKSELEFYEIIRQFIVPINERHLSVAGFGKKSTIPDFFQDEEFKILPLALRFFNDSTAYIIRNVSKDSTIQLPSQIVAINHKPISEIRNEIAQYIPKDNGTYTWKNWEISQSFPVNYFFHIDTTSNFLIEWKDSLNQIQKSNLKAVSTKFYRDSIKQQSLQILGTEAFIPSLRTDYYPKISTGYLKIGTFSNQTVSDNKGGFITYKEIVKRFFRTVNEHKFNNIIIDLRNNTGGKVNYVNYLLSFIVKNNSEKEIYYTVRDRKYWWGENAYVADIEPRKNYHFNGHVYILTNGGSYSASVMVTTFAKALANATIVGKEAGGRFNGTTAGRFKTIELKNSHILVRIPEASFTYFVLDYNITNITPDIPVQAKAQDFMSYEKDHQLQVLLGIISQQ